MSTTKTDHQYSKSRVITFMRIYRSSVPNVVVQDTKTTFTNSILIIVQTRYNDITTRYNGQPPEVRGRHYPQHPSYQLFYVTTETTNLVEESDCRLTHYTALRITNLSSKIVVKGRMTMSSYSHMYLKLTY